MFQTERNDIISAFKKQDFPVLVATDVAARGLDIPHIRNVVNFDVARDIDTHTHRVGIIWARIIDRNDNFNVRYAVTLNREDKVPISAIILLEGKGLLKL